MVSNVKVFQVYRQCVRVHMSYLDNGRRIFHFECTQVHVSLETKFLVDISNRACPDRMTFAFYFVYF